MLLRLNWRSKMTTSTNNAATVVVLPAALVKLAKAAIAGNYKVCDHSKSNGVYTISKDYVNKNRIGVEKYVSELTKALKAAGFIVDVVEASDKWETKIKAGVTTVESSYKVLLTLNVPTPVAPAADPVATTDANVDAPGATTDATVDTGDATVAVQVDATVDVTTTTVDAPVAQVDDAVAV